MAADQPQGGDAENQENRDPSEEEGSLRKMFVDGVTAIATHRRVNVAMLLFAWLAKAVNRPGLARTLGPARSVAHLSFLDCLVGATRICSLVVRITIPASKSQPWDESSSKHAHLHGCTGVRTCSSSWRPPC